MSYFDSVRKELLSLKGEDNKHFFKPKGPTLGLLNHLKRYGEITCPELIPSHCWYEFPENPYIYIDDEKSANSYNWNGLITVLIQSWGFLRNNDCAKNLPFSAISFHLKGDVRANYTDYILLPYTIQELFEYLGEYEYTIKCRSYDITHGVLDESGYISWQSKKDSDDYGTAFYEDNETPEVVKNAFTKFLNSDIR